MMLQVEKGFAGLLTVVRPDSERAEIGVSSQREARLSRSELVPQILSDEAKAVRSDLVGPYSLGPVWRCTSGWAGNDLCSEHE